MNRLNLFLITVAALFAAHTTWAASVHYESFESEALGEPRKFAIQLPPGYETSDQQYPVLYFLHGMNNSEEDWEERGFPERVESMMKDGTVGPMIVVLPRGDSSFYIDSVDGKRLYEQFIIEDLPRYIEENYRAAKGPKARAVSGVSMGGYAAIRFGFKYPDRYASASAFTPFLLPEIPKPQEQGDEGRGRWVKRMLTRIFGDPIDQEAWKKNDPFSMVRNGASLKVPLRFYGAEHDRYGLQEAAQEFHELLNKKGLNHDFEMIPGDHGWRAVSARVLDALQFHWKNFPANNADPD